MSNNVINNMDVNGKREHLDKFKIEVAKDDKNCPFSFQKILPEPKDTTGWENKDFSSSDRWRYYNWGSNADALWPEVKDHGDYLTYSFCTYRYEVLRIYEAMIFKYYSLSFKIDYLHECDEDWVEIEGSNGEIKKKNFLFWRCGPWKKDKSKDTLFKKDLLNNTIKIVESRIFHPDEYDQAYHRWI